MTLGRATLLFLTLPMFTGCLYLHSPARQKLAEESRRDFESTMNVPVSAALVTSHQAQADLRAALTRELHSLDQEVQLAAILSQTWDGVAESTVRLLTTTNQKEAQAAKDLADVDARLKEQIEKLPGVAKELASVCQALAQASLAKARFAASQTLLAESLVALLDSANARGQATENSALTKLKDILARKVEYTSVECDDQQKIVEKPASASLGTLLNVKAPGTPGELQELLRSAGSPVTSALSLKPPGIATAIIGLAYDIARAQEERLSIIIDETRKEKRIREVYRSALQELDTDLKADLNSQGTGIAAAKLLAASDTETIRATLTRLAAQLHEANGRLLRTSGDDREGVFRHRQQLRGSLHLAYNGVATNFRLRVVRMKEVEILADRIDALEREKALRLAGANLAEREAVIRRGLEGLVAFHSGGVTTDDVARIIGIAQTIGIFIIAGGVL